MTLADKVSVRTPDWYLQATRWTQLTFTDDDPVRFDLDFWVDVMRRTRSNALCLSAGGYMAFYPTQVPFHRRSQHLGDSDPFGDVILAARDLDMHVMARVDPHAIHDDVARAHPEWLARDESGSPMPHPSFPGLWQTDPFTTYNREFITEVALEIVREYDVDALFANRWEGPRQVSHSEQAAHDFRRSTGFDLPRLGHSAEVWAAYREWRSSRLSELVVLWDNAVRSVKPHVRFIPNRGEMLTRDLVPELVEDRYPMFFVDKQGRDTGEPLWVAGRVGKRARGLYPDRPVALISSVGPESNELRWKDSVADPNELITWICDGFAHGALPWFTKFKAECFDDRWIEPIATAFGLHAKVEPIYRSLPATAEVLILDARQHTGKGLAERVSAYQTADPDQDGFCQALVEARIPFEFIAIEALTIERLRAARVLVLPNTPGLTAEQAAVITLFVETGGSVVAAHDAGLGGTEGQRSLLLGDLLGVRLVLEPRGPVKNNYIALTGDHPISCGYAGAQRIVGGTRLIGIEAVEGVHTAFDFVPDYPDLPMEEVYPRPGVVRPAVVTREHTSGGRTVYIAFNLGEIFAQTLQSDHARLIANTIRWARGDRPAQVEVSGAGFADVAVRADHDAIAVTIVNLNNSHAMRGQTRETVALPPQEIAVCIPDGRISGRARLVVAETEIPLAIDGRVARAHVPSVEHLEVVHVTWD